MQKTKAYCIIKCIFFGGDSLLCNLHTHTSLCDGANTPEEMILAAIEKGFGVLGFSGHAQTNFGEPFGITDINEYIRTINALKKKYKDKIEIVLGIEEDALNPIENRKNFRYLIGSHHFVKKDKTVLPIDLSEKGFFECLKLFDNNIESFTESYYKDFCDYILKYKPDIIGHFDLITKFDERLNILLDNKEYLKIAEKYLKIAIKSGCLFEVNTGAMSRGYRTSPYPSDKLLKIIKNEGGGVILSSDAHSGDTLDFGLMEAKLLLKDIGFREIFSFKNNEFIKTGI